MRIRRCTHLFLEAREYAGVHVEDMLRGDVGIVRRQAWFAMSPHLPVALEVDAADMDLLGSLSPTRWDPLRCGDRARQRICMKLLGAGLVIGDMRRHRAHRRSDECLQQSHWHPIAALHHALTRWDGIDAVTPMRARGADTAHGLRALLGAPPTASPRHGGPLHDLPAPPNAAWDQALRQRTTCRNFDTQRRLPLEALSNVLHRTFGVTGEVRIGEDAVFHKKNVPSGGGLHPIEAYVVAQCVEGLGPGVYHYLADSHLLEDCETDVEDLSAWVGGILAGQDWFEGAHALVILVPRFDRTFWKYRGHAKALRVVTLEAGHLAQLFYMAATDEGLGAFVTAAVNEQEIERALGLTPMVQGVMAVCGLGWRSARMTASEFDPAQVTWRARKGMSALD